MKKIKNFDVGKKMPHLTKLLRVMKITCLLILIALVQVSASTYSQSSKLTLDLKNATLAEVFKNIEELTDFRFFYDVENLNVSKKITVTADNANIKEILNDIFNDTQISYEIYDRYIILNFKTDRGSSDKIFSQQQKSISGTVTDESGQPLPGATVVIKGTAQGTVSDANGKYSISNVSEDGTLVFTFVGMKTQEILVAGKTEIDVVLAEETIGLEEVVAIGYGTARKKDLTGSVTSVRSEKLEDIPVTSAAQAMQGQLAGVQIIKTEGSPDADIKIRIRGGGSITQDNTPLLLVDGFPVDNINDIAPTDIESIDVLKDASSTAIYGARGANGVVLVTTKKGMKGKGKVSFNTYYGIKELSKQLPVLDGYDFVLYELETIGKERSQQFFGDIRDWDLYKEIPSTNWQEEAMPGGSSLYNNLSIRGGNQDGQYNISLTRNDEDEIIENSEYRRTNLTVNLTQKVNNWLTVTLNTMLSDAQIEGTQTSEGGVNGVMNYIMQYRPVNGIKEFIDWDLIDPELFEAYNIAIANPIDFLNNAYKVNNQLSSRYNGQANIKLSKSLSYDFTFGQGYYHSKQDRFYGMTYYYSRLDNAPSETNTRISSRSYKMSNVLTYRNSNFLGGHNLVVIAGEELNYSKSESQYINSRFLPAYIDPETALRMFQLGTPEQMITSVKPRSTLSSYFGRINYNYKNKYYASATFRADGSSKFASGNQWGYFPAFGASWNISEEDFMEGLPWLDLLKLRASYGEAGNNRIPENAWQKTFVVTTNRLIFDDAEQKTPFIAPESTLSNRDLKWETTITQNLGLDFTIFKQRLSGTVEAYYNKTQDLLVNFAVPASVGYGSQWQNIGQTSNRGLEFSLNGGIVDKRDFRISASFNIGFNRNRIDDLGGLESWIESSNWMGSYGGLNDYLVQEGDEIGLMYGYETEGIYSFDDFDYNPENQTYTIKEGVSDNSSTLNYAAFFGPGALKLKDQDGDLIVDESDKVIIGRAQPKFTGGFNLTGQYKGFDLSAYFNFSYGNDIYNASKISWSSFIQAFPYRNLGSFMENYFRYTDPQTGDMVKDPAELAELNQNADMWNPNFQYGRLHSWAIEDGSFLRLNTLTLGYTLPAKLTRKIGIDKVRAFATGYNLWIWTKYSGWDPEVDTWRSTPLTPGMDYSAYPRSRSMNFGLNVEF